MILSSRIDVKINFTSKRKRRSTKQARLNDYSEANPRKSIIFDTRTNNGKGTSFTYFNFIRYTEEGGGGNIIIPKRVESSTAPSESTVHFISTTLIEGHDELQGAGLYQRKVKFTSRTPVCIFSSRIKYQLNSVNYSRCLVYWVFQ